jgi:hypothetical protein
VGDETAAAREGVKDHPEWGSRRLAEEAGRTHTTVEKIRRRFEYEGQIPRATERGSKNGKRYRVRWRGF